MMTSSKTQISIPRVFDVPKGYARAHSARPFAEADALATLLVAQGRVATLVYSSAGSYAVYVRVDTWDSPKPAI